MSSRRDARMPAGTLPGIDKPVSRLVMGVDNQRDLTHAAVMFDDFVEQGGNTFDTAWLYGDGTLEPLLGKWIRSRGVRDDVVVIGKGAHTPHCDPESLRRQLAESLDRLDTDHVDLYLMHRDNLDVPVGEFVDAHGGGTGGGPGHRVRRVELDPRPGSTRRRRTRDSTARRVLPR